MVFDNKLYTSTINMYFIKLIIFTFLLEIYAVIGYQFTILLLIIY